MPRTRSLIMGLVLAAVLARSGAAQSPAWLPPEYRYDEPFFAAADYDPAIPTVEQILGYRAGDRPADPDEVRRCFETWAATGRLVWTEYARSHEGRPLNYAVIASPENAARLGDIRTALAELGDPRGRSDADVSRIIEQTPALAWLAYCIHGDEISGTDAALAVTYHLIAARGGDAAALLSELVVIIDPLQNPDGRNRYLHQLRQFGSRTPVLDATTLQHEGHWPGGRTNHYFTDLNRDWAHSSQPETRGRQQAVVQWNPQLFVDSHEMWAESTFLFNPAREPFNPNVSPKVREWWLSFAGDAAKAFDRQGWSYYTREWADFWYPGYSDGWSCLHSAIGILYEQAGTGGAPIRLKTGRIMTYRQTVHQQATVTMANLTTLAQNRAAVMRDFVAQRRAACAGFDDGRPQTFLLPPGANPQRLARLLDTLRVQGVEFSVAASAFAAGPGVDTLGVRHEQREFPAGTIVVSRRQPRGAVVGALLDFDPRMTEEFLQSERRELESRRGSRLYDITGWALPFAYGVDAYWAEAHLTPATTPYAPPAAAPVTPDAQPYGWVLDVAADATPVALAHLMQNGVAVRVAEKAFQAAGRRFAPGSLLIRRHDNAADVLPKIVAAATAAGATVHSTSTARSPDETPDLGGEHFLLLTPPRVALLADAATDAYSVGELWHFLDVELGLATSLHAPQSGFDMRRYNVIVLPEPAGGGYGELLGALKTWIQNGGTLIAIGGAADWLAQESSGVSAVRQRSDMLDSLGEYASAVSVERLRGAAMSQPAQTWDSVVEAVPPGATLPSVETTLTAQALEDWRQLFAPTGIVARGVVDTEHWLVFGATAALGDGGELPIGCAGGRVLLSRLPVQTPVRFAAAERLRLSGLLWPEAAVRLADSAWLTRESVGRGQVILFAHSPDFRHGWPGTRRLLANAVLLGPGVGASAP